MYFSKRTKVHKYFILVIVITTLKKSSRGAGALEKIKYLFTFIFSFLRSGVEAKRGVEFRHSTRNASRTRLKVGNGVY